MNATDKLTLLASKCKCGVYVEINSHRDVYETAEQAIYQLESLGFETDSEVRQKMIESDTVVTVQFYPDTPVGFHHVFGADLDSALDAALKCVD